MTGMIHQMIPDGHGGQQAIVQGINGFHGQIHPSVLIRGGFPNFIRNESYRRYNGEADPRIRLVKNTYRPA